MRNDPWALHDWLLAQAKSRERTLAADLEKRAAALFGMPRSRVRAAIRDLLMQGGLAYTYEFGASFLTPGYAGPVALSKRVAVAWPGVSAGNFDGALLSLDAGAAFGTGRHPSTRLACGLLEKAIGPAPEKGLRVLDVGCGSGILALASLFLGAETAVCVDVDPCAVFETRANAKRNGLLARTETFLGGISLATGCFGLILANLRAPTLAAHLKEFGNRLVPGGALVVSGLKEEEAAPFLEKADNAGFRVEDGKSELGWTGLLLKKKTETSGPPEKFGQPGLGNQLNQR